MDNEDIPDEKRIAFYQIIVYSILQILLTAVTFYVCIYHSFRGKWTIMILFSVFVSVDYIGQIVQWYFFINEVGGAWNTSFVVICICGDIGPCITYLYLVALSIKPYLIRKAKAHIAKMHLRSVLLPLIASLVYIGIALYNIFTKAEEIRNWYIEIFIYSLLAVIAVWNILLKKFYYKKYKKSKCYSWTIVAFFIFDAMFSVWLALIPENDSRWFLIDAILYLLFDLGPIMAFMYFALFYRIASLKEFERPLERPAEKFAGNINDDSIRWTFDRTMIQSDSIISSGDTQF